jgi:hypothetical protein
MNKVFKKFREITINRKDAITGRLNSDDQKFCALGFVMHDLGVPANTLHGRQTPEEIYERVGNVHGDRIKEHGLINSNGEDSEIARKIMGVNDRMFSRESGPTDHEIRTLKKYFKQIGYKLEYVEEKESGKTQVG